MIFCYTEMSLQIFQYCIFNMYTQNIYQLSEALSSYSYVLKIID